MQHPSSVSPFFPPPRLKGTPYAGSPSVSYLLALGTDALFHTNLALFALAGALAVVVLMPQSTLEVIIAPLHLRYLEVLIATAVGSVLMAWVLDSWLLADTMTVLWFVTNVHIGPMVLLPLLAIGRAALRLDLLKPTY